MRRWVFRCCAWLNELLHSLQWCGFATVGEDLFYKAWSLDCGVLAPFALFWLLWGMFFDVISEIVCALERIIALCVIVGLLPIVNEHVPFQITSQRTLCNLNSCVLSLQYDHPNCNGGDHQSCSSLRSLALDTIVHSLIAVFWAPNQQPERKWTKMNHTKYGRKCI